MTKAQLKLIKILNNVNISVEFKAESFEVISSTTERFACISVTSSQLDEYLEDGKFMELINDILYCLDTQVID